MTEPSTPETAVKETTTVPAVTGTPPDQLEGPKQKKHKELSPEEIATIAEANVEAPPKIGPKPECNPKDVVGKTWINWRTAVSNYGVVVAKPRKNEGLFPSTMDAAGHTIVCNDDNDYAQALFGILKRKYLDLQQRVAEGTATPEEKKMKMENLMDFVLDEELARLAEEKNCGYPFAKPVTRERNFLHKLLRGFTNNPKCNVLMRRMAYRFALLRLGEKDGAGVEHYSPFGPFGTLFLAVRLEHADQVRGGSGGETYSALYYDDRNWFQLGGELLHHHLGHVVKYPFPDGSNKDYPQWPGPSEPYTSDQAISYKLHYPGSKGGEVTHVGYITKMPAEISACRKIIDQYQKQEAKFFAKDWYGEHVHGMAMTKAASIATGVKLLPGLVYCPKLATMKALHSHIAQKSADTQRANRHNTPIHPEQVRATRSDLATERLTKSAARQKAKGGAQQKLTFDG